MKKAIMTMPAMRAYSFISTILQATMTMSISTILQVVSAIRTSCSKASNGQRLPCPALLFSVFMGEAGQRPQKGTKSCRKIWTPRFLVDIHLPGETESKDEGSNYDKNSGININININNPTSGKNQLPKGIKWSAAPLPCSTHFGFHGGKQGSVPKRGQSPVEFVRVGSDAV